MATCCVPLCPNVYKQGAINVFSFHKFPRDERIRQLWIDAIADDNLDIKPSSRVCSYHFHPSDFKSVKDHGVGKLMEESYKNVGTTTMYGYHIRLEKWAVPSLWHGK